MQVVTPPMDTIQEEPDEPPPYDTTSQLNVNSSPSPGSTSPVVSPHNTRRNKGNPAGGQGHLMNNMLGSLSGIRSTVNLSRGHLHDTSSGNHNKGGTTINIGYVQGIDTSRANVNRLSNSSRDLHRIHHDNNNHCGGSGTSSNSTPSAVRHLLQTLHGTWTVDHDNHHGRCNSVDSPVTDRPTSPATSRARIDSLTSQASLSVPGHHGNPSNPRPRSHCFTVEHVDDSTLGANSVATPTLTMPRSSAGQNAVAHCGAGITNATFVIDMNNTAANETQSDLINSPHNTSHHVAFNSVPQIITQPPSPPDGATLTTAELPTSSLTGNLGLMDQAATDQNSSTESLPYIKPDPNQCTVTSLTPLLPSDSSDSEPEASQSCGKPEIV